MSCATASASLTKLKRRKKRARRSCRKSSMSCPCREAKARSSFSAERAGAHGWGREAVSHHVLRDDARKQKVQQVLAAARFGAGPGHLESSERLPGHHGTR